MRLVISFPTTYRTLNYVKGFSSYSRFFAITPITPGAPLSDPALEPHTSTPTPASPQKLNQRAAQIRGHFRASSSRLGDSAPAPLGAILVPKLSAPEMLIFLPLASVLVFPRRGR